MRIHCAGALPAHTWQHRSACHFLPAVFACMHARAHADMREVHGLATCMRGRGWPAYCVQAVARMGTLQVRNGDVIRIDAEKRSMDVLGVDDAEWDRRRGEWSAPPLKASQGTLYKYIKAVTSASLGCVTDL